MAAVIVLAAAVALIFATILAGAVTVWRANEQIAYLRSLRPVSDERLARLHPAPPDDGSRLVAVRPRA